MSSDRHALTLIDDPKFAVEKSQLATLQESAIAQLVAVQHMQNKAAKGAVLSGITLLRVKASLPHGEFKRWLNQKCTETHFLTVGYRQAAYYMSLARSFLARTKVTKPALLALPGDQTALDLGDNHPSRDLLTKLDKFVGELSLAELLDKYDIKAKKALGGKREHGAGQASALTPEELEERALDEVGLHILALESLVEQGVLQDIRTPAALRGVKESITKLAKVVEKTTAALGKEGR